SQFAAVREVGLAQFPRLMLLREEHFLGRAFRCPPLLDPPLQRPQLSVAELAWLRLLEVLKQGLSLQPWFHLEPLPNVFPNLGERIEPRPPLMLLLHLTRQPPIPQVFSGGLSIHARVGRRDFQRQLPR